MFKSKIRGIFILVLLLPLTGCFFVTSPILSHSNADPLPGGAGRFRVVSETGDDRRMITVQEGNSLPYMYTMTWNEDGNLAQATAMFDHIKNDLYVMQVHHDDTYIIIITSVHENGISYIDIDEDVTDRLLKELNFAIVKMPLFGDKGPANKQIAENLVAGRDFAIDDIGLTLHGSTDKILLFTREMATQTGNDTGTGGLLRIE